MENTDHEYLIILTQGGLTISFSNLVNYLLDAFAVLSATSRNAAKEALSYIMGFSNFICENLKSEDQKVFLSTIVNVFFNNKRTIFTSFIRKDNVDSFKKQKRVTYFFVIFFDNNFVPTLMLLGGMGHGLLNDTFLLNQFPLSFHHPQLTCFATPSVSGKSVR